MEVFHSGYQVSFHHLSPVLWEHLVFGPVKSQALQGEVDKILGKGALKVVENPRPGYYSLLFRQHQECNVLH